MEFGLVVITDRLLRVEEAGLGERPHHPPASGVAGDGDRALGKRLVLVVELGQVDVGHAAHALAARAGAGGQVEAVVERRPGTRLAEPAEDDPQHRVGVGGGAHSGAGVGAHPLLVDDDRRCQPLQQVDLRPRQRRHEALHEGAVGLVDQPLRLRGDRAEHQRTLARAGDAGEHGQPALRKLDADVLEVVHPCAVHADSIVAIGGVQRGRLRVRPRGRAHRCQLTAFFTSSPIFASSVAVNSFSAKEVGHMAPSSRFATSLKPNVAYLALNLSALWKKQTTLPSLAYAGIPYHVFGESSGALALMIAWSRSAMVRSCSGISAIFASRSLSPSALFAPRRPRAFSSLARSFMA